MSECICGAMAGKTRVLVTNALHFLPRCDRIYVVHEGTLAEDGSWEELISTPDSLLVQMGAVSTPRAADKSLSHEEEKESEHGSSESAKEEQNEKPSNPPTAAAVAKGKLVWSKTTSSHSCTFHL